MVLPKQMLWILSNRRRREYSHPEGHNKGTGGEIHEGDKVDIMILKGETLVIARRRIATVNARMPSIVQKMVYLIWFLNQKRLEPTHIEILKAGVDGENETTKSFPLLWMIKLCQLRRIELF